MEENQNKFQREINVNDRAKIIGLKAMAFKDYIAARNLLNQNLLHQATFLINTCIEKEMKAYLYSANIDAAKTHETTKLFNLISQLSTEMWTSKLNLEFIKIVSKIYKSRYFENLGPGYNFVINKKKFLAELDYTYSLMESKSTISALNNDSNPYVKSHYKSAILNNNPFVFFNNFALNNKSKHEFLQAPDLVYEFRITTANIPVMCEYSIPENLDFEKFNYEAMKQIGEATFNLSQLIADHPIHKVRAVIFTGT